MLTKNDLDQLRKLIREEIEIESQRMRTEIKLTKIELCNRIGELEDKLKSIEITISKR